MGVGGGGGGGGEGILVVQLKGLFKMKGYF